MHNVIAGPKAANPFRHSARHTAIRRPSQGRSTDIAPVTGPFSSLAACRNVLVVADVENLAYGARDLGLIVDFSMLADRLKASLAAPALHAVFSARAGDDRAARLLSNMGWTPYQRPIIGRLANADFAIAFQAAALLAASKADACVIATGDGGLALDIAHCVRAAFSACTMIATMSLAGSTSRLLDTQCTSAIDLNIEIGRDAMRVPSKQARPPVAAADANEIAGMHYAV